MIIESLQAQDVTLPLVSPFTTSFSTQTHKRTYLLRIEGTVRTAAGEVRTVGWGECVSLFEPLYSSEYLLGAREVTERYLVPALRAVQDGGAELTAETLSEHLAPIVGHQMAKSALEMAMLDAQLRAHGLSFATYLGAARTHVPSGVSVGIQESIPELLDAVGGYLAEGYVRIKLKIQPGWDIAPVAAVRREFGDDVPLQVDANAAYTLMDAGLLRRLDEYGLLLIEQPLAEDDMLQHAKLATQMTTPMCLDESISSAKDAADAISMGAASVINVKPGRVGGYLEARRIHDIARAHGVAVWCGGMLETGLGRAANAGLAAMSGFTLPGDISASNRFYAEDITEPVVIADGSIAVPTAAGLGATPLPELLTKYASAATEIWAV